ncbi:MAG TPA: translation initiation factor IF-2 N-terminal domain-containing protein, partial [Kofleriaceae bacterium]|nr:translation initiation factor IF-2 N-terminal domain-containing protein [Kofleriaceae bacterium]
MRVYEIAREVGIPNKDLLAKIRALGLEVNNHMSSLDADDVARIKRSLEKEKQAIAEPQQTQRLSSTVLRRRSSKADEAGEEGHHETKPGEVKAVDRHPERPGERHVERPGERHVERPIERHVERPVERPIERHVVAAPERPVVVERPVAAEPAAVPAAIIERPVVAAPVAERPESADVAAVAEPRSTPEAVA